MDKLISVIVPVYNVEKYLKKCIDSIINQTYRNLEIILVDDGSPDNAGKICDEYALKDHRIRVIHKENGGLSDARNAGIDVVHGEYLSFVDSDDYLDEHMMEKLLAALISEDAEMSMCRFTYVDDDGHLLEKKNAELPPAKSEVLTGFEAIRRLNEGSGQYSIACCKLYKRDLFQGVRFPVGKRHEDEFVSHVLFMKCNRVACIGEALYYYVQRNDSIMGSARIALSIKYLDAVEALLNRAVFLVPYGMLLEVGKAYFNVVLKTSYFFTHFTPKTDQERLRMKEISTMIQKNRCLKKYCTAKERIHIALFFLSPRLHQALIKIVGRTHG